MSLSLNLNSFPLEHFFIPSVNKGMTSGDKLALVFHGRGDSLESYKILTKEINVTGLNYLLVNAPFKQDFGLFEGYTWYDDSYSLNDPKYVKSLTLLKECTEILFQQIPQEDLFLMGFSQGGRMAVDLALDLKVPLAGVVALSPRLTSHQGEPEKYSPLKETPFYITHGEYDAVIPFSETKELAQQLSQLNLNVNFHSYPKEHEIDPIELSHLRAWINDYL